uniref:PIG-P domain-containing protein n=1 Tax=Eutreptiella gymnastica TaxID=73025 RepID=A0A7S1I5M2_9EUGL
MAAEGKGRSTEVYGFVSFLLTMVAFAMYLFWAYVPETWYVSYGITYYPDRYWAVAVPAWVFMAVGFYLVVYYATYLTNTPGLDDWRTITDNYAKGEQPTLGDLSKDTTILPVADIPISVVNRIMHQNSARGRQFRKPSLDG